MGFAALTGMRVGRCKASRPFLCGGGLGDGGLCAELRHDRCSKMTSITRIDRALRDGQKPPSHRGMAENMIQAVHNHLKTISSRLAADGPGFSAAIVCDGDLTFEMHHGLASLELGVPLNGDSAYYLASESKQFTAACVMTMVRHGQIALDDDVVPLLPELKGFGQAFPLRSLLNHSSGIPEYLSLMTYQLGRHESDYFGNSHILSMIALFDEVDFPTSTDHRYSNSNYILLATLVERIAGVPARIYAQNHLFSSLGMNHLTFDDDRLSILPNRVFSYESDPSRPRGIKQFLGNANTVGDGGIYGSTNELVRWEREWHRQWAEPGSLLHDMLQPSALLDGRIPSYRFGLEIGEHEAGQYVFHGGGLWGFSSLILRFPERKMSLIHLSNCDEASVPMEDLLQLATGKD